MRLNKKEKRIFSITIATWGIFCVTSGLIMNSQVKTIVKTKYNIDIETRKIDEAQAKTNEIKLKNIEVEVNNPISVDIKDYLIDNEKIDENALKTLKLDTSLVNINQAGTYQYSITYKKKKYIGNITIKEKELPNLTFTLKTIKIKTEDTLSSNPRTFIEEEIPDEVYNNLTLDISNVNVKNQGDYTYYIIYKSVTYQGKVEVRNPGPTIITPDTTTECPKDAKLENNTCKCDDSTKKYDETNKKCISETEEETRENEENK